MQPQSSSSMFAAVAVLDFCSWVSADPFPGELLKFFRHQMNFTLRCRRQHFPKGGVIRAVTSLMPRLRGKDRPHEFNLGVLA